MGLGRRRGERRLMLEDNLPHRHLPERGHLDYPILA